MLLGQMSKRSNLKEEGGTRKAWRLKPAQDGREHGAACFYSALIQETKWGLGTSDPLPKSAPASQTALPAGEQMSDMMDPWETFHVQVVAEGI